MYHVPFDASLSRYRRLATFVWALLLTCLARPLAAQTTYTPYQFVTIAGTPGVSGSANGTGTAALFASPDGVTVDGNGNLYVSDTANSCIRMITPGRAVTTLAVTGEGGGSAASFNHPSGATITPNALVMVVADTRNSQWQVLEPTGPATWTVIGTVTFGGAVPVGVGIDANYNVYGSFLDNGFSGSGIVGGYLFGHNSLTYIAASGEGPAGDTNGPGNGATFSNPTGVAVDSSDNLYIADNGNSEVRKITPTPVAGGGTEEEVSTLAGLPLTAGSADGTGTAAQFNGLNGVAVDSTGNVYVADTNNDTIRKITPAGVVTTLGGVPGVAGSADGIGSAARFNQPFGIAVDTNGNIYVADTGSNTIRKGFIPSVPPTFTLAASPAAATVATGRTAVFNAIATGTPAPTYQWTLNGSATIPGATVTNDPILVITGATSADIGTITCTASSTAGSVASSATLSVVAAANPGYLTNLSGRGLVGSGAANALFGGFGIGGTGTKQLLIRGMGPSLVPGYIFGISDALTSTMLQLYNSSQAVLAQDAGWGGTPALMAADALVGAYPPISTTSLDSILYLPVATGSSSASVGGVGGATGDAVIELYDADAPPLVTKLTNVAVRAPVGTGGDILFGGFAIGGTTDETVLIRAIGPRLGLSPFNLSPVLAQPVLTLYLGATPTGYTNTAWGGDAALVNAMATVGAYALTASSQDSLLLVTLPPGSYSAEVSGLNGTTGIAAVEVYEVQ